MVWLQSFLRRTRSGALLFGVTAGLLALWGFTLAGSAAAALPSNCSLSGDTVTCSFFSTGAEQTFDVPTGVSSVQISAVGAPGSNISFGAVGGKGGTASVTASVTSGDPLYVEVGGLGQGFAGGWNGGGDSTFGAGGGGASDVRTCSMSNCDLTSNDTRLVVAGGGGGAGRLSGTDAGILGGVGGDAGGAGAAGMDSDTAGTGGGGGGAPTTMPAMPGKGGAGGIALTGTGGVETNGSDGNDGALGQGGAGGSLGAPGGGGGGGYYGGGAGGNGANVFLGSTNHRSGAGGGGGGSSYAPGGNVAVATGTSVAPSVTISYTDTNHPPVVDTVTLGGATGTACAGGNNVTLDFAFADSGDDGPWAVDIDWGDGSTHTTYTALSQDVQPQQSHSYGPGSFTITVSVTDQDGGNGTNSSAVNAVSHLYAMSGILAPFNPDGTSVWKYGSTLPVKVQITDCNGQPVRGLAPKVGTTMVSSKDPTIGIDETASTSSADTTGVMRYDATAGQYIYNFGSKYLSDPSATYYMTVKGTDSNGNIVTSPAMVQVKFGLKTK